MIKLYQQCDDPTINELVEKKMEIMIEIIFAMP